MMYRHNALSTQNNKKIVLKHAIKTDFYPSGVKRNEIFNAPGKTIATCAVAAFKLHPTASQVVALPPRRPILAAG